MSLLFLLYFQSVSWKLLSCLQVSTSGNFVPEEIPPSFSSRFECYSKTFSSEVQTVSILHCFPMDIAIEISIKICHKIQSRVTCLGGSPLENQRWTNSLLKALGPMIRLERQYSLWFLAIFFYLRLILTLHYKTSTFLS